jgi:hypothetical protein
MNGWRHWVYLFPPDDCESLWEVMDRVPVRFGTALDWTLTDKLLVAVTDETSAIYLRLAFGGNRPTGSDGLPILEDHEVLISAAERAECETLLRENCPAEAEWFSVIVVHAQTDTARRAFDEAYGAVVGRRMGLV